MIRLLPLWLAFMCVLALGSAEANGQFPATLHDFRVSGTQYGDAHPGAFLESGHCSACHAVAQDDVSPFPSWQGSKMAHAGRNPLFFAQLATANQDVDNVGYYCLRCHVPKSIVSGTALDIDGTTLKNSDQAGVDCHFCHAMADPIFVPGQSPERDQTVLALLDSVPGYYANSMFVLDPDGVRRGSRLDAMPYHEREFSPFHADSAMCGTCHDVGNVATSRQPDGSYRYNTLDTPVPDENPWMQFPLERTYTEWKLSAFADGGVDMGGRFGGDGVTVVSSCQDCHMPRSSGRAAIMGPERSDVRSHAFAGASVWTFDIIGRHYADDPAVDLEALAIGMQKSREMLARAVSLELAEGGGVVRVRIFNETGHKLPTGHIEGRRAWLNMRIYDADGGLLIEHGGYESVEAELEESSTVVYEMFVGLSEDAAATTGLPTGPTGHMVLADTIVKDSRIPPRGYDRAAFEAAGAPAVGRDYADGQFWDDVYFRLPDEADRVEVVAWYQTASRHYIEELREHNVTDDWGEILYQLWNETGRSPPEPMAQASLSPQPFLRGDFNGNGVLDPADAAEMMACYEQGEISTKRCLIGDFTGDASVGCNDFAALASHWPGTEPLIQPAACRFDPSALPVPSRTIGMIVILIAVLLLFGIRILVRHGPGQIKA